MPPASPRSSLSHIGEFDLIKLIQQTIAPSSLPSPQGIGDDTAIIKTTQHHDLLISTDLLIEDIHFKRTYSSFRAIGQRAAAVNISDIAAMGGIPRYLLVGLAARPGEPIRQIRDLYQGMNAMCQAYGVKLIGGDTCRSKTNLFLSLTIIGEAKTGQAICRGGAQAGDLIYVTGTLGDAGAGLMLLQRKSSRPITGLSKSARQFLINRHRLPTPKVEVGKLLTKYKLATAAIDLSDGLSGDLPHLCRASKVGALIETSQLPVSTQCQTFSKRTGYSILDLALHSGEDFELLFTVAPKKQAQLERIMKRDRHRITQVGTIHPRRKKIRMTQADGSITMIPQYSYEHFHS